MRQNPTLRTIGNSLLLLGVVLAWLVGVGLSSVFMIAGLLLGTTGSDTELTRDGVKLGFTRLKVVDLYDVYEANECEIVLVTKDRRRHRIKKWHYAGSDWEMICGHIRKLKGIKSN